MRIAIALVAIFATACGGSTAATAEPSGGGGSAGGGAADGGALDSEGTAGSSTGGSAGSSGGAGATHDASASAETGAGGDASLGVDARASDSDAPADAPSVLGTCVFGDAGSCPAGYDCACGGPGVGQCECHKRCQAASDCSEPNAMCGCSLTDPKPICVSACFCFCN
jgi:hypothetical protein